jgi:prepilin-type processing-associated H-X9-DG protein
MCIGTAGPPQIMAHVNSPANVIMLSEVFSSDLTAAGQDANSSAGFNNIVTGIPYWVSLSPPNQCGVGNSQDGTCGAYPNGVNGAISAHHNGLANFAFADGHCKALLPTKTVPNATVSSGSWWTNGEYDTGAGDNTPSMWMASHD